MFVKNKEKIDFHYRKGTYLAVLKALTVSYVDENKVSARELLDCYGQRIDIISRDLALQIAPHVKEEKKETKRKAPKVVETVRKEDLNDKFIEKILGEIGGTQEDEASVENINDLGLDELDGIKELESNTGDKDVDDFLNGKTDILPEGTQIISDEEAQKLLEGDNNKPDEDNNKPDEDNNKPDEDNNKKPKARASKSTAKAKPSKAKSGRGRKKSS